MFAQGLLVTFEISIASELLGILIGLVAAMARLSRARVVRSVAVAYIDFFRGVPLLVTLVWIYYGVSLLFHINISAFAAGVSGLGITYGAFLAEVFRAGIEAIPKGQTEASYSLGLSRAKTMRYVSTTLIQPGSEFKLGFSGSPSVADGSCCGSEEIRLWICGQLERVDHNSTGAAAIKRKAPLVNQGRFLPARL
jgi:His/Glu/Gln/Arg/opine family amino acid ABC transporter permease subunit